MSFWNYGKLLKIWLVDVKDHVSVNRFEANEEYLKRVPEFLVKKVAGRENLQPHLSWMDSEKNRTFVINQDQKYSLCSLILEVYKKAERDGKNWYYCNHDQI